MIDSSISVLGKVYEVFKAFCSYLRGKFEVLEEQKVLPSYLGEGLIILAIVFLVIGDNYLNKSVIFSKQNGFQERIKESSRLTENSKSLAFKTAYAFFDNMKVDGSQITLSEFEKEIEGEKNYYFVIENSALYANHSPFGFYLPTIARHGIIKYLVKEGDTLGKIAADFGVSLNTIIWANNLKSGSVIKPNQELVILPVSGVLHKVLKGETLSSIAKKYKADLNEIIAFNNLDEKNEITIGQELIIPNGTLTSPTIASTSSLKSMTEDTTNLPDYKNYYAYPTSGGWNKGVLHYYNAVDIINSCGSPIYASNEGMVIESKGNGAYNLGYGNLVKIQHLNGTVTVYGHLNEVLVKEGQQVAQGQLIGRMGNTGNSNGCHLHFEVRGAKNPFVLK
ncbi:MAG TPA: M23 family metallopeptidase [Candidatus Paceibacterota bacterium]|nr:M23 family metallopeptidase [Candidatus Paceibacterota bacterium]HOK97315.1 M23 family metallopeptidase [Candidatus Paceibacterota bacterium]HPP64791.1 M23 family metallopeptidase [Candidatus Paceibacterota bacterium]